MKLKSALLMFVTALLSLQMGAQPAGNERKAEKKETDAEFSQRIRDFNDWLNDPKKLTMDDVKSVTIGKQTWTRENLNTDKFRNGDPIPEAKTKDEWLKAGEAKKPAWCYLNNDPANGGKYGRLYNWYAVNDARGLAPRGWHVPTEPEWDALISELGGQSTAGAKMRSNSGWKEAGNGTNESVFDALPGSCRDNYATFYEPGKSGYWWSATPFIAGSAGYGYKLETYGVPGKNIYDANGLSVRLLKD